LCFLVKDGRVARIPQGADAVLAEEFADEGDDKVNDYAGRNELLAGNDIHIGKSLVTGGYASKNSWIAPGSCSILLWTFRLPLVSHSEYGIAFIGIASNCIVTCPLSKQWLFLLLVLFEAQLFHIIRKMVAKSASVIWERIF
jgi:hypothetical protein